MELTYNSVEESADMAASSSNHLLENFKSDSKRTVVNNLLESFKGDSKRTVVNNLLESFKGDSKRTVVNNLLESFKSDSKRTVVNMLEGLLSTEATTTQESKETNGNSYTQPGWLLKISGQDWKKSLLFDKVLPTRQTSGKSVETRNVRLLPREDVMLYGEIPKVENKVLVKCNKCERVLVPSSCKVHFKAKCKVTTSNLMTSKDLNLTKKYLRPRRTKKIIEAKELPAVPLFAEKVPLHPLEELASLPEVLANLSNHNNQRITKESEVKRNDDFIKTINDKMEGIIYIQRPMEDGNYHFKTIELDEEKKDDKNFNNVCNQQFFTQSKESYIRKNILDKRYYYSFKVKKFRKIYRSNIKMKYVYVITCE